MHSIYKLRLTEEAKNYTKNQSEYAQRRIIAKRILL